MQGDAVRRLYARFGCVCRRRGDPTPARARADPSSDRPAYGGADPHCGGRCRNRRHRRARICAAGHGGQALLTQTHATSLTPDTRDLGEHRLKDLLEPQPLYQLGNGGVPAAEDAEPDLPTRRKSTLLVGREAGADRGSRAATRAPSVDPRRPTRDRGRRASPFNLQPSWLTSSSRLWWRSSTIRDPDLVEPTIAQTIGVRRDLPGYLREPPGLLSLDNLEQVLGRAPRPDEPDLRLEPPEAAGDEPRAAAPDARAAVSGAAPA